MSIPPVVERHWFDVLVVGLTIGGIAEVLLSDEVQGSTAGLIVFAFLWGLPLLARRRLPVIAPTLVFVAVSAQAVLWPHSVGYQFCTFMIVLLATGLYGVHLTSRRDRLAGAAVAVTTLAIVVGRDPEASWTDALTTGPIMGVAWLIGDIYRTNTTRTAELRERAERLERERESEARAAVAEERTRIAREMHDVVAHSLSVMVVQAEAAEAMLDADPERARRPLAAVQETGRSALTELRRMLGVLREMSEEGPALAPQPGLAGLDALVAHVTDAGLPVTVRVEGDPRPLPPGVDLSAFRIVQEGLTNALKHAGPARAEVVVRYGPRELGLTVTDDGRGFDPASNGGGHGLVGMRERVALYGGRLSAGPRPAPERGFSLTAALPLDAEPAR